MSDVRVQAQLASGTSRLVAWVDTRAKVGKFITLKNSANPKQRWEVLSVSEPVAVTKINQGWRVGGL